MIISKAGPRSVVAEQTCKAWARLNQENNNSKVDTRSVAPFDDHLGSTQSTLHHVDCPKGTTSQTTRIRPFADFDQICKQLKSESLPVKRFKLSDYYVEDNGRDSLAEFCGLSDGGPRVVTIVEEPLPQTSEAVADAKSDQTPRVSCTSMDASKQEIEVTADLYDKSIYGLSPPGGPQVSSVGPVSKVKSPSKRQADKQPQVDLPTYAFYEDLDGGLCEEVWHCETHSPLWNSETTLAIEKLKVRSNQSGEGPRRPLPSCAIRPTGYRNTGEMRVARNLNFGARSRLDEYVNEKKAEYKAPPGSEARKAPLILDPREAHPSRSFGVIPSVNLQIT